MSGGISMDIGKLITLMKTEFPKDALEIQACLDLLCQSIDKSVNNSLKVAWNEAFEQHDYENIGRVADIATDAGYGATKVKGICIIIASGCTVGRASR